LHFGGGLINGVFFAVVEKQIQTAREFNKALFSKRFFLLKHQKEPETLKKAIETH